MRPTIIHLSVEVMLFPALYIPQESLEVYLNHYVLFFSCQKKFLGLDYTIDLTK